MSSRVVDGGSGVFQPTAIRVELKAIDELTLVGRFSSTSEQGVPSLPRARFLGAYSVLSRSRFRAVPSSVRPEEFPAAGFGALPTLSSNFTAFKFLGGMDATK